MDTTITQDQRVALAMLQETLNVCTMLTLDRIRVAFTREFADRIIKELPKTDSMVNRVYEDLQKLPAEIDPVKHDTERKMIRQDLFALAYGCGMIVHFLKAHTKG